MVWVWREDHLLPLKHGTDGLDEVAWVVVGYVGAPPCADAGGPVDEDHGDDGSVPLGLDGLPIVVEVVQDLVVLLVEDGARHGGEVGKDVTGTGGVLSAIVARAELSVGEEEVDVVGPNEALSEVDDGGVEGHLAVVVPIDRDETRMR